MQREIGINNLQNRNNNFMQITEQNINRPKSYDFRPNQHKNISKRPYDNSNKKNRQSINNIIYKRYYSDNNDDIFDMRIYLCLKMLGIGYLQPIFERNNITLEQLLILSMDDLTNLGLGKEEQKIINQFSLDYIKNGSYYSIDELQKYFKKNKNKYKKYRTISSFRDVNKIKKNIKYPINTENNVRNNLPNQNINNNYNNFNYFNKRYNPYSNKENYLTINEIGNYNNNYLATYNNEYFRRNNSALNINPRNNNIKDKIYNNIKNNKYNNNNIRRKLPENYDISGSSGIDSITPYNYENINNNSYNNNNYINNAYTTPSNLKRNLTNYNLEMRDSLNNDYNYNLNHYNNVQKNNYFTGNRNNNFEGGIQNYKMFSEQNKRTKNLNNLEKKQINNILSNRITSLKKKQNNKITYRQNNPNNLNYNNKDIRNDQGFKMLLQIEKIKTNKMHNNNYDNYINNQNLNNNNNITNTKINNYINNIYNVNKSTQNHFIKSYKNNNQSNERYRNNFKNNDLRYNKNNNINILTNKNLYVKNISNDLNANDFNFNKNITISNEFNYKNFEKELFKKKSQDSNRNFTLPSDSRKNYFHNKNSNNIVNRSQKNYDVNNNMYNYYKINNSVKDSILKGLKNIKTVYSADIRNNYDKNNYFNFQ